MRARGGSAEDVDEGRRLSVLDLVGLAAGGVVGSGWLLAAGQAHWAAGPDAVWAWVIGGVVMLVIAAVMVELGIAAPKTGGLIFLPLQAAGPLVATVVAAALWIVYAVNPASEAAAAVRGLAHWFPSLLRSGHEGATAGPGGPSLGMDRAYDLSLTGALCAVGLMLVVVGFNLLPARRLIRLNLFVTVIKVLVPLLIVACLLLAATDAAGSCTPDHAWYLSGQSGTAGQLKSQAGHASVLYVVLGGGIIYAYIGFQAPLDFAGNIKRRGMGEAARLRWAVYGTLVGAVALYTMLQYVFSRRCGALTADMLQSPYAQFALAASMTWLAWLVRLNAVLSPLGSGIVFTHALTREVAALSRAHLTHRGLQTARRASFRFRGAEIDAYWMILVVNLVIGLTTLALVRGNWEELVALNSVPIMVVYAMPGVVLVALPGADTSGRRKAVRWCLSYSAFVSIALVIHEAGWADVWRGMAGVGVGSVLLLALPWLAVRDLPYIGRVLRHYDAREHLSRLGRRGDPAVRPLLLLVGYLVVLVSCTALRELFDGIAAVTRSVSVLAAVVVFPLLVRAARRYMDQVKPTLPGRRAAPSVPEPVSAGT
ncbi:APC family permease [Streptomyces sp. VRA16 Mangrove soil]|uniref:APC family permease n=1 Tax=Streptomyces sp. VRA16 Mangrove soil TaxID=2817434 RepID=UPI001A9F03A1|nr:APC family permease [Streptomyces sp. VRA16 Mangrove soil]MBO1330083.1 APC family permease [Streptomyces sp. VRA16 Mangrove soil]